MRSYLIIFFAMLMRLADKRLAALVPPLKRER